MAVPSPIRGARLSSFLFAWLFYSVLLWIVSISSAQDGLPPVRQLIAETLRLCNEDREESISSLNDLAAAQCYLGDFAAARKNLLPYERDNIFQQSAHQT